MKLLDIDECPEFLLESISLTETEYELIQKSGALENINVILGKIIDDYEDEAIIEKEELIRTLKILDPHTNADNVDIMEKLTTLNMLAINKNTGLFFFL
jgi:hypothetical protein